MAILAAVLLSTAQVWVAPAVRKVRPTDQPTSASAAAATIFAAQNEFESFHVVVSGAAAEVSMSLEGLADSSGHTITGREITLYREALIEVTTQSGGDGATGWWPDALIPDVDPIVGEKRNAFPFSVPSGESRAVLVDIHVPATAPAGVYTGVVNVSGGVTAQVPVTLTVWDFAVPSTSTLKSAFGLDWNAPCMGHGSSDCMDDYAGEMALRARYVQAALDNRISIRAPYWDTAVTNTGSADWSDFDFYSGQFFDGTANTRLKGAKLTAVSDDTWASASVAGWATHFLAMGWKTTVFTYVCDEPPATCSWSAINPRDTASHAGSPDTPTLVTTTIQAAQQHGITGIDLFTPVVDQMENKPGYPYAGNQRASYPDDIWWYQSCDSFGCSAGSGVTGWPTMAIDSDATRNRAMEWLSFSYDIHGELYYETAMAYYGGDPWVTQYNFGGNGDGTLFYPGTVPRIGGQTEIPIESLRMKMIRDGMEDYELLSLAADLGLHDQAVAISRGVFPVTYQATATPQAIDAARAQLSSIILSALGRNDPPPEPDAGTPPADGGTSPPADAGAPVDAGTTADAPPPVEDGGNQFSPPVTTTSVAGGCNTAAATPFALCAIALAFMLRRHSKAR
ncbi:MAG: glycoside hydrolase domain-containing protein [Myxococcales bacterium]